MKKAALILFFISVVASSVFGAGRDLDVRGRSLTFKNPPFFITLPSDLQWVHSASVEHPAENSLTRTFLLVKEAKKEIEEMLIVQVADKTNPQAGPMAE